MPAIAHQNKILGNTSGGGSTILVTTSESTLYGQTVTLSDGTTTLTGTFSNAGECEFTGVMMVGTLTATSGTASTSINVPYFGVYSIILSLFSATITATFPSGATCTCVGNGETYTASTSPHTFTVHGAATYRVTATIDGQSKYDDVVISTDGQTASITIEYGTINVTYDNAFRGTSITCVQGGTTITKTAPSGANTMTFYPPTTGNWVISGTVSGTSYSKTANVTSLSTSVSVSLETVPDGKTATPTDDIEKWLQCGQITGKSYTTLSQVLDDAETYERLLSDSNACDYMARSTTWASTICADADAMMRLGKYDYACDALLADSTWASAIVGSTYFESVLNVKVPTMTSNTTPSGTCFGNSAYSGTDYYKAFDNNTATYWQNNNDYSNCYIGYHFTESVVIKSLKMTNAISGDEAHWAKDCVLQGSNTGNSNDWTDIKTFTNPSGSGTTTIVDVSNNTTEYSYYRVNISESYEAGSGNARYVKIPELQFYGRHTAQTDIIVTAHGGDTVYYMENGSPVTLTTADRDTGIGTVDWSDLPKGAITLYSSTAKNPSDLTADYSKTVYITEYTTQIYLMPENTLYWYGYESEIMGLGTPANGFNYYNQTSFTNPTKNYTNIVLCAQGSGYYTAYGTLSKISVSNLYLIGSYTGDTNYSKIEVYPSKTMNDSTRVAYLTPNTTMSYVHTNITPDSYYIMGTTANSNSRSLTIYALWYE